MITFHVSGPIAIGASAYNCSKIALVRLIEHVSADNPDPFVVSVSPGGVDIYGHAQILRYSFQTLSDVFLDDDMAPSAYVLENSD